MAGEKPFDLSIQEHDVITHQTNYNTVGFKMERLTCYLDDEVVFLQGEFFEVRRDEYIVICQVMGVNELKLSGKFDASEVSLDGVMYEIVFEMMMLEPESESESDSECKDPPMEMEFKVTLPNGMNPKEQSRTAYFPTERKLQLMEFLAGEFKTNKNLEGTVEFSLHFKRNPGLAITGAIVRPRIRSTGLRGTESLIYHFVYQKHIECMKIYVRDLLIHWGQQQDHWCWYMIKEKSQPAFVEVVDTVWLEVVELLDIVWLEVSGKFDPSKIDENFDEGLVEGTSYEVVFFIKLTDSAEGWGKPVTLQLLDQKPSQHIIDANYKGEEWKELKVGEFIASQAIINEGINFSLLETDSGQPKKGLVIKNVVLRKM